MPSDTSTNWSPPTPETLFLLRALQLPKVGVATVRRFADSHAPFDLHALTVANVAGAGGVREPSAAEMRQAEEAVHHLVERCERLGIRILSFADRDYPKRLREIVDFPPVLYVLGDAGVLHRWTCVAVVGTRKASTLGKSWASKIAKALATNDFTTVSGLALGIDAAAHRGALDGGGRTIAVMAHGLDTVAPKTNAKLAAEILEHGGALISEHPPGFPPWPAEFVRRNRIQSGISVASIVVESAKDGGAIHQARFTTNQGRVLLAVRPPSDLATKHEYVSEGTQFLIDELHARALTSQEQLVSELSTFAELSDHDENDPGDDRSQLALFSGN